MKVTDKMIERLAFYADNEDLSLELSGSPKACDDELQPLLKEVLAALSTDAEPVAWQAQSADGIWRYVEMPRTAKSMGMPVRPLYAATPAPAVAVKATPEALEKFTAYFVKNYPGPDTIIFDPKWHAPKLFRAAVAALSAQVQHK